MNDEKKHFHKEDLIEYFYGESQDHEKIKKHLQECHDCNQEYLSLQSSMAKISNNYKADFWTKQRDCIMSKVGQRNKGKSSLWAWWLRPAFAVTVLTFLLIGLYSRFNHPPVIFTQKDVTEERLLEQIAELNNQPLTPLLDYLDFQEEEVDQPSDYAYSFEKLELFGYWSELDENLNI
ncbi:MAG: hypothetical protein ACMUIP_10075 [bacterium]